jgi:hypothetical protein
MCAVYLMQKTTLILYTHFTRRSLLCFALIKPHHFPSNGFSFHLFLNLLLGLAAAFDDTDVLD